MWDPDKLHRINYNIASRFFYDLPMQHHELALLCATLRGCLIISSVHVVRAIAQLDQCSGCSPLNQHVSTYVQCGDW